MLPAERVQLRVLLSAPRLGGAGGTERAVHSIALALRDHAVDVVVDEVLGGPLAEVPMSVAVRTTRNWRYRAAAAGHGYKGVLARNALNPARRRLGPKYDVHYAFQAGPDLTSATRCRVHLVNAAGSSGIDRGSTLFAMEAPGNSRLIPHGARSLLLPPPLSPLPAPVRPSVAVPPKFLLTVFNPYSPVKGGDSVRSLADVSSLPLVWCHSRSTGHWRDLPPGTASHHNIVHVTDPDASELRWLYEQAHAYVCFSLDEGFGWAIADALQHCRAVVSRPVGVLSYPEAAQPGVLLVDNLSAVDWRHPELLEATEPRDLNWLAANAFVERLRRLVALQELSEPPEPGAAR